MGTSVLEIFAPKNDNVTCDHWDYSINSVPFSFPFPISWALRYWNPRDWLVWVSISLSAPGGCYSVTVLGANTFPNSQSPTLFFLCLLLITCFVFFSDCWTALPVNQTFPRPLNKQTIAKTREKIQSPGIPTCTAEAGKACPPFPSSVQIKAWFV